MDRPYEIDPSQAHIYQGNDQDERLQDGHDWISVPIGMMEPMNMDDIASSRLADL